jgi:pimeloyl-ACP methyl ester carboxylesterase
MPDVERIEVGGLRIAFRRAGSGPSLVLLHGALSDGRTWRRQLDDLSDGFDVIAWDAPGCGSSDDPPQGFSREDYGDCLAGFIAALGLRPPHLAGLSFGSILALELYRRFPDLPRSLVLASAYAGWAGSLPPDEVERRIRRASEELELPPERWVDDTLATMFTASVPPEVLDEARTMMMETRPQGVRPALEAFGRADLRDVLPRITVPTLLLYGERDQRSPSRVAEELHRAIPTSSLAIIPGVGHDSATEAPEAFNAEVRRFLRSVTERGGP